MAERSAGLNIMLTALMSRAVYATTMAAVITTVLAAAMRAAILPAVLMDCGAWALADGAACPAVGMAVHRQHCQRRAAIRFPCWL